MYNACNLQVEMMIVTVIHELQVIDRLSSSRDKASRALEWWSQLRYYTKRGTDEITVKQVSNLQACCSVSHNMEFWLADCI